MVTPGVNVSSDAPNIGDLLFIFEESKEAPKLAKELRVQKSINFDDYIFWELVQKCTIFFARNGKSLVIVPSVFKVVLDV